MEVVERADQVAGLDAARLAELVEGVAEVAVAGDVGDLLVLAVQLDVLVVSALTWAREVAAAAAVDLEGGDRRAAAEVLERLATSALATLMQPLREVLVREVARARLAQRGRVQLVALEGYIEIVAASHFIEGPTFGERPEGAAEGCLLAGSGLLG